MCPLIFQIKSEKSSIISVETKFLNVTGTLIITCFLFYKCIFEMVVKFFIILRDRIKNDHFYSNLKFANSSV